MYGLVEAIETCKNVVARHRDKSVEAVFDIALNAVRERVGKKRLPNGWREHLEHTIAIELGLV